MQKMMEESREASARDTRQLVHDMGTQQAALFTDIAGRLAPAAPAAQNPALTLQMQKAQCDAQVSTTALEMQKLAAHLEQQVEELTAWLEANRSVERLQALVPHKENRLAACLRNLASMHGLTQ